MFRQPQRTSTSRRGLRLELAPQAEGLVGEPGVGCVQIVVAERARATERSRHRIADAPALEHDDPPEPLRRVIRREQPHHASSDDEEIAVTVEALAAPDAHALLARLRDARRVAWLPALGGWLVLRRDLALQVMGDAATFTVDDPRFSTGRVVGPSMLTLDGDEHQRHRAPFARPFRLQAVRERFTELVVPPRSTGYRRRRARRRGRAAARLRGPARRGGRDATRWACARPTPAPSWAGTTRSSRR